MSDRDRAVANPLCFYLDEQESKGGSTWMFSNTSCPDRVNESPLTVVFMVAGSIDASFSTGATAATATAATTTDPRLLGEAILTDIVIERLLPVFFLIFVR